MPTPQDTNTSRKMHFGRYDYAAFSSFLAYAAGSIIIPVALVTIARDLAFPLESGGLNAGGLLHLARTIPMVATMLLCGFLAARIGNRKSLALAVVLMAIGLLICAISPIYGILFIALMIAGLGEGIIEGLATPFIQNIHVNDQPGRYINFAHGFWPVGIFLTVIASGIFLSLGFSWRYLVAAIAILCLIPTALLLLPARSGHEYPENPEPFDARTVLGHALTLARTPRFWLYFTAMFLAGGGEFSLTFWAASYIQLNFTDTAWAGSLGIICFALGMFISRTGWGYLIKQQQLKQLVTYSAIAGAFITILFPFITSMSLFMILLFFAGIAAAPYWPSVQSYAADRLPHVDTTMLFILLSCAGIPGCGVFTWLIGLIGYLTGSLTFAFFLIPMAFTLLAIIITIDWLLLTKSP
ncbi:MFS transporter [Poriferisphaera sp. WC338]|uniref:MFS transporter n=1 Tax=Poriferisphaera sp. WC338 TaxID=3425129 RepID=UPI003D813A23